MDKKHFVIVLLLIVIVLTISSGSYAESLQVYEQDGVLHAGKGWSTEYEGLKVCYFTGTHEEIGRQHGQLVIKPEEKEIIKISDEMKKKMKGNNIFINIFKNIYSHMKFIPAFKRIIPDEYQQEMKGLVNALSGEQEKNINDLIMGNAAQDLAMVYGCSSFAAWNKMTVDNKMIVGRNLDNLSYSKYAEYQYLAFYKPDKGIPFVTLNYPSYVGVMHGMNDSGVVVAMNYSKVVSSEVTIDGLPFMIMLRDVLQKSENIEEAVNIIKETPRTIGLNILIASSSDNKAVVLETSANRLYIREADSFIYATNRFQSEYMKKFQADGWFSSALRDSRFKELEKELKGKIDYNIGISILRDKFNKNSLAGKGFLAGIERNGTIASILFSPADLKIWVSNKGNMLSPEGKYIGFNAKKVWESGQPIEPFSLIAEPESNSYYNDWLTVRKAEIEYKQGNKNRVLKLLKPLLMKYPESEYPLLLQGISCIKANKIDKGISHLYRLIDKEEIAEPYNLIKAYFWLGVTSDIFKNNREQAKKYYKLATAVEVPDINGSCYLINLCRDGLKSPVTLDENGHFTTEGDF